MQTLSIIKSEDLRYFIGLESLETIKIPYFDKIDKIEKKMDPTKIIELETNNISKKSQITVSKFTNL